MTNILRDVGEDYRNGRLYLPREELITYGIREEDIAAGRVTDNWRQFMKFQIERTRQLYEESWAGVKMLEREGQLAIGAASVSIRAFLKISKSTITTSSPAALKIEVTCENYLSFSCPDSSHFLWRTREYTCSIESTHPLPCPWRFLHHRRKRP
jgi:hypothetical protein